MNDLPSDAGSGQGGGHRRRPRYPGANPRRFEHRYKELRPEEYPGLSAHILDQGRTPAGTHVPVLMREVIEALHPVPGEFVADCTLGYGGHALEFGRRISPSGRLVGLDVDGVELEKARERLAREGIEVRAYRRNFEAVESAAKEEKLDGFDVIFADLGVSSMQVDDPARGFSYKVDGPLDMRMDPRLPRTAADRLARIPRDDLADALRDHADEPDAERIADAVCLRRGKQPIARTLQLAELVLAVKGITPAEWKRKSREGEAGLHPAALTFQALRILVNREFETLDRLLGAAPRVLRPGGRIGIVSFHSGEDRRVKAAFRDGLRAGLFSEVSPEAIRPQPEELRANPRSGPAKFRWAVRAAT